MRHMETYIVKSNHLIFSDLLFALLLDELKLSREACLWVCCREDGVVESSVWLGWLKGLSQNGWVLKYVCIFILSVTRKNETRTMLGNKSIKKNKCHYRKQQMHCIALLIRPQTDRCDKAHGAITLQLVWVLSIEAYIHARAHACEHVSVSVVTWIADADLTCVLDEYSNHFDTSRNLLSLGFTALTKKHKPVNGVVFSQRNREPC